MDKLQSLEADDKEDIFEFIFLDLCIEFCQEVYCEQDGMKLALNYISNTRRKPRKKAKGIKTSIR